MRQRVVRPRAHEPLGDLECVVKPAQLDVEIDPQRQSRRSAVVGEGGSLREAQRFTRPVLLEHVEGKCVDQLLVLGAAEHLLSRRDV